MTQDEKDKLLDLFSARGRWCQDAEARDASGSPVHYSDEAAVAWDITGGMCRLFGWERACELFIHAADSTGQAGDAGPRDRAMVAMGALQDFNDPAYAAVAADVDLSDIESLYIGFGNRRNPIPGGEGTVFFDDIRLYPPRCVPEGWMPDLNDDCIVDYHDLRIMALNWLQVGDLPGQFVGNDEINLKDFAEFADHWLENRLWPPN